jgi:hypothetical protein
MAMSVGEVLKRWGVGLFGCEVRICIRLFDALKSKKAAA